MSDVHGVYRDIGWMGDPTPPKSLLNTEEGRVVAPEATSYTVTKEWLEEVRNNANYGRIKAMVDEILPPPPPTPREIVLATLKHIYGGQIPTEIQEDAATDVMKALRDGGWKVVRDGK